jgi:hypothetical protein
MSDRNFNFLGTIAERMRTVRTESQLLKAHEELSTQKISWTDDNVNLEFVNLSVCLPFYTGNEPHLLHGYYLVEVKYKYDRSYRFVFNPLLFDANDFSSSLNTLNDSQPTPGELEATSRHFFHITVGDDSWNPTVPELKEIKDSFQQAALGYSTDDQVVITRNSVRVTEIDNINSNAVFTISGARKDQDE